MEESSSSTYVEDQEPVVLAFVNSKSGGRYGPKVIKKFKKLLPEGHIFDLSEGGPRPGLLLFEQHRHNMKCIACGGDGTVGWLLSVLDDLDWEVWPDVAVLPLGTGNDMARILLWGNGYSGGSLVNFVNDIKNNSRSVKLDRWLCTFIPYSISGKDTGKKKKKKKKNLPIPDEEIKNVVMNNYFSIGLDSKIALDFDNLRSSHPGLFRSKAMNYGWYGLFSMKGAMSPSKSIRSNVHIKIDGEEVRIKKSFVAIIVANIPSYAGGTDLWGYGGSKYSSSNICDNMFEVVGITGALHGIALQGHISHAYRLGQVNILQLCCSVLIYIGLCNRN
eukprot:TRINITY_DN8523_c0_g1_i1.p1 TRINITY_DN8523_c0_g1~~TRINITY_DN8523_c0_g1_i1.p1  ORF type:complete len:332 (-),score=68.39 TRINITY_DN8523_c0_g1_i1:371-1366(-)